ncbi:hypothetical protein BG011_006654 [Mortierella polycephala]|uniref:Uncharacterized protein n=1 Tax=Mortierella polycephala TaxID=41804 RepID=A0A9P6QEH4_9FUNG|nr:hypothetical protein BG011_006654 [Mortierella polycephala]
MSIQRNAKKSAFSKPKPGKAGVSKTKDGSSKENRLLDEILAMGGSEQDLELLDGIDSGSEIEDGGNDSDSDSVRDKSSIGNIQQDKKRERRNTVTKSATSGLVEEPGLKNEVASFMKSLFGSALVDYTKMDLAAEEEDDEEKESDKDQEQDEDNNENQSEEGWETEGSANDSGDDSMDDLPQELKDIAAQLDSRKRKADSTTTTAVIPTPAKKIKKIKTDTAVVQTINATMTTTSNQAKTEKKKELSKVQEQMSAILGKPSPKAKKVVTVSSTAAGVSKAKASLSKSSKKPTWKLGDGWSKGFEEEEDDSSGARMSNKIKGKAKDTHNLKKKKHVIAKSRR